MSTKLVTGHNGIDDINSSDFGAFNAITIGSGVYVFGSKCTVPSANTVHVSDGDLLVEGRHARVIGGVDLSIANGTQGLKRYDLICASYSKDMSDVETMPLVVVQGTPSTNPVDPSVSGSILAGDSQALIPLWRIPLDGITVGTPVMLAEEIRSLSALSKEPKTFCGTKVVTVAGTQNSAPLFTQAEFTALFGRGFDAARDFIGAMNADGAASGAHVEGVTWQDGVLYMVQDVTVSGNTDTRVNYFVALGA